MANKSRSRGGNARKIGRDKIKGQIYRTHHTRERNKVIKIKKHLTRHPNDRRSKNRLVELERQI